MKKSVLGLLASLLLVAQVFATEVASTMKIIKPGIKHKKVYRGESRDCQGVFEWNREELSDCRYDERERQELCHVVCPECGST